MSNPYSPPSVSEIAARPIDWCWPGGCLLIVTGLASPFICAYIPLKFPLEFAALVMLLLLIPGMVLVAASLPDKSKSGKRWKAVVWILLSVVALAMIITVVISIPLIKEMLYLQRARAASDRDWKESGLPDHLRPIMDRTFEQ